MQAIEFETTVDPKGNLHFPEKYRDVYGKPVDGLAYQKQARGEWE